MDVGRSLVVLAAAPIVLSAVFMGAHFLRVDEPGLTAVCMASLGLLFLRRSWVPLVISTLLILASAVWVNVTIGHVQVRILAGEPWGRMAAILGSVALLTALSTLVFSAKSMGRRYSALPHLRIPGAVAFLLTALALAVAQLKVPDSTGPLLLLERFYRGAGWLEILLLAGYAAWIIEKMLEIKRPQNSTATWRRWIWLSFSVVFFSQLVLGLVGFDKFLMTGKLHFPVPALILAGPIFRGGGYFMPILFVSTLLIVGPAWCSHLCYIGAWDHAASLKRRRPVPLPSWTRPLRSGLLALVVIVALLLRLAGASTAVAGASALSFGILGVIVMIIWSRKTGSMTHCSVFCPVGLVANMAGRISPFRIRIKDGCTDCYKCRLVCRYDALNRTDIRNRRPASTCTLCGDCVGRCKDDQIEYSFAGFGGPRARAAFLVLIVSLHAVFMGVARM